MLLKHNPPQAQSCAAGFYFLQKQRKISGKKYNSIDEMRKGE